MTLAFDGEARLGSFSLRVALRVAAGERVALRGPNGAGKTTLLRVILGLVPVARGTVRLGDRTLDDPARGIWVAPEERSIGLVFQDQRLFPHLDVRRNLEFAARAPGRSRAAARAAAHAWLERMQLEPLAARLPASLSGGEAQRVALARALAAEPAALLLDEPLAALDVGARDALRAELATYLRAFEGPMILVTHDALDAAALADRVLALADGALAPAS